MFQSDGKDDDGGNVTISDERSSLDLKYDDDDDDDDDARCH